MGGPSLKAFDVWMLPEKEHDDRVWKVVERGPLETRIEPVPFALFVTTVTAFSAEEAEQNVEAIRLLARQAANEAVAGIFRVRRRPGRRGR